MIKEYFVLRVSDESAAEAPSSYDWYGKQGMSKYRDEAQATKGFPNFTPILKLAIYDDKEFNKRNDFIHSIADGFIISEKVKSLFEQYTLPPHKFFPIKLYQQKKVFGLEFNFPINKQYYNLYFDNRYISDYLDFIDYANTTFSGTTRNKEAVAFKLENSDQLRQFFRYFNGKKSKVEFYSPETNGKLISVSTEYIQNFGTDCITFNKDFDLSLDLFSIPQLSNMTYLSKSLLDNFNKENITGLVIYKPGELRQINKKITYIKDPELKWVE